MSKTRGRRLSANGTEGRVYGGDPQLIHVPDGMRGGLGSRVADFIEVQMRLGAEGRTEDERSTQDLCPGCFMVVGFNALVDLADRFGQTRRELGLTMADAFLKLAEGDDSASSIESIKVRLDAPEPLYV